MDQLEWVKFARQKESGFNCCSGRDALSRTYDKCVTNDSSYQLSPSFRPRIQVFELKLKKKVVERKRQITSTMIKKHDNTRLPPTFTRSIQLQEWIVFIFIYINFRLWLWKGCIVWIHWASITVPVMCAYQSIACHCENEDVCTRCVCVCVFLRLLLVGTLEFTEVSVLIAMCWHFTFISLAFSFVFWIIINSQ